MVSWNLGDLFESVVDAVADREAVIDQSTRLSFTQLDQRSNRMAQVLAERGVGVDDHVALMLHNSHEYLEAMLAAFKLRAVPVNVNTRYTTDELRYLFGDARPRVVLHEPERAGSVSQALSAASVDAQMLATGRELDAALEAADPGRRPVEGRSGDDRYVLYTGGTTGLPKGVIWRHQDLLFAALAGGNLGGDPVTAPHEVAERALSGRTRILPASPFTHGTAHWTALATLLNGGSVVIDRGPTFDPVRLWDLVDREMVTTLVIVGDAFARPLVETLDEQPERWTFDDLLMILSGGAGLSPGTREQLLAHLPWVVVIDGYGTSETGGQGSMPVWAGQSAETLPRFHVDEFTAVLDDAGRPAPPGSGLVGRLARRGHIPIGYLGDPARSAGVFVEVGDQRWAVPGDLAKVESDGSITLLGRGSSSINTGGEKVFPEEVELVLKAHPAVFDAVVVGLPDERFGERVAAVVQPRNGLQVDSGSLDRHCRGQLADFKIPRRIVIDEVLRRPTGKADLNWARQRLT